MLNTRFNDNLNYNNLSELFEIMKELLGETRKETDQNGKTKARKKDAHKLINMNINQQFIRQFRPHQEENNFAKNNHDAPLPNSREKTAEIWMFRHFTFCRNIFCILASRQGEE